MTNNLSLGSMPKYRIPFALAIVKISKRQGCHPVPWANLKSNPPLPYPDVFQVLQARTTVPLHGDFIYTLKEVFTTKCYADGLEPNWT